MDRVTAELYDQTLKDNQYKIWRGTENLLEKVRKVYNLYQERFLNAETNNLPDLRDRIQNTIVSWQSKELTKPHVKDDPDTTVISRYSLGINILCKKNLIFLDFGNIPESPVFISMSTLQHVEILDPYTISIGAEAFFGFKYLETVILPKFLRSIGESAFSRCKSLKNITLPDTLTFIGEKAFEGCTSLENVTLPEGLTTLGDAAFRGCTFLTSINLPDGLTIIRNEAFNGCSSFQNITLPEGLTTIESKAFEGCTSLTNITLPEGLTTIGDAAFEGCTSLENVTIPMSVISMGQKVFYECYNVRIKVAEGVVEQRLEGFRIPYFWSHIRDLFPNIPEKEQEQILLNTVDTLQARSFLKLNRYQKAELEQLLWNTSFWKVPRKRKDYM